MQNVSSYISYGQILSGGYFLIMIFFSLGFTASKFLIHINMKHFFQLQIFIQISLQERGLQLDKTYLNFFEVLQYEKFFSFDYIKLLSALTAQ